MTTTEVYSILECLSDRTSLVANHSVLSYIHAAALAHSIDAPLYREIIALLETCNAIHDELSKNHWQLYHMQDLPSEYWAISNEYDRLSHETAVRSRLLRSRWYRLLHFKASPKRNEAELRKLDKQREALRSELNSARAALNSKRMKVEQVYLPLKDTYEQSTNRVNVLVTESEAWKAWITHPPWEASRANQTWFLPNAYSLCLGPVQEHRDRPMSTYFEAMGGKFTSITKYGMLVLAGIKAAGLHDDTTHDYDVLIDLVGRIVAHEHELRPYIGYDRGYDHSTTHPVEWDEIDIQEALSKIGGLRAAGVSYEIRFIPGHTLYYQDDPYLHAYTRKEHCQQEFAVITTRSNGTR